MSSSNVIRHAGMAVAVSLSLWLMGCERGDATAPIVTEVQFAKGGAGGGPGGGGDRVTVEATDPPSAPQGRKNLNVRVLGSGFDDGSVVEFELDGNPTEDITTNSTSFVDGTELIANIDVADDAIVDLYDVAVTTSRKKKGVGIERFQVTLGIVLTSIETSFHPLVGAFTCGIDDPDGDGVGPAYCWGNNSHYSLGLGGKQKTDQKVPTKPVGGDGFFFSEVRLGNLFACAIEDSDRNGKGPIYCWGQNANGELGDGTKALRSNPTPVASNMEFFALDVGMSAACALAYEDGSEVGEMYCWGGGMFRNLMPIVEGGGKKFRDLATDGATICGIDADDAAWCWGDNQYGQVGNGETSDTPVETPTLVQTEDTFHSLAVSFPTTCGLTTAGEILCWGRQSAWGGGPVWQSLVPIGIDLGEALGDTPFSALSPGFCAIGNSGQAYCWARNEYGEIGNGTVSPVIPYMVDSPFAVGSPGFFTRLGDKNSHTCGIAIDGFAYCWGSNDSGELGDGSLRDSPVPLKVAGQRGG